MGTLGATTSVLVARNTNGVIVIQPDLPQAIVQAGEHLAARGLRPSLIEQDYYVTEALRVIASTVGAKSIFKGGTSLAKGWNLIQRFGVYPTWREVLRRFEDLRERL